MSFELMTQCAPLQMPHTAKSVLMALANMQSEANGRSWPSLSKLGQYTCLSRNAVIGAIKQLEAARVVIADRSNARHTSYVVNPAAFQAPAVPKSRQPKAFPSARHALPADPASAPQALAIVHRVDYQAQDASAPDALPSAPDALALVHVVGGVVHDVDPNSKEPLIKPKENQKDLLDSGSTPDLLTDIPGGKAKAPKTPKAPAFDASTIDLPEWLSRELWCMWCRARKAKGKPITEDAARLQLKALERYRTEGYTPEAVIEHAVASSNQGLFPPPGGRPNSRRGNAHTADFSANNYEEDLQDGRAPA